MADRAAANTVTLLTTWLSHGGAEVQVIQLALGLKGRGWDVTVASMREPAAFVENLRKHGIDVVSLGMSPGRPSLQGVRRWVSHVRGRRPAVVHSHMVHANVFARVLRPVAPSRVLISTAHSINEGGGWRDRTYRLTDPLADLTTNVSEAATARYIRDGLVPVRKMQMVPNGVNTAAFARDAGARAATRRALGLDGRFVWLCVARFAPAKDHATLLDAFARVAAAAQDAHLLLAGDGDLREGVETHVRRLGLEKRVSLLGVRDDIAALMSAADGYVMSSVWEGLPMVLLEAASADLPIVATDVGGNAEIVLANGVNRLVPPCDAASLAGAMLDVSARTADADGNAAGNATFVREQYGMDRVLNIWEHLYTTLLDRHRP